MSTPEHRSHAPAAPAPPTAPLRCAEEVVADVDHRLKRYVGRAERRAITADLLGDLRTAEADGCDPAELIGPDVDGFVRRTVEEGGYAVAVRDTGRITLLGVLVAVPAVVVGYLVALTVVQPVFTAVVSANVDVPHVGMAGAWAGVGSAGAVSVFAALAVLEGSAVTAGGIAVQVAGVLVPLVVAIALARSWGLRRAGASSAVAASSWPGPPRGRTGAVPR